MLKKILVPYDGSKYSDKALKRAMELAHNLDSEILLLTVTNVSYISPPGMLQGLVRSKSEKAAMKKYEKSVKQDIENMLKTAEKKCQEKGITVSYIVKKGDITEEILKFAKKRRVTLIVMGAQGLSGLSTFKILGSTSRKVSEYATCPVLLVR
ncbi:MAG: universal stress protein [Nitrosopumilaceae archaeon]|nr:universal stress protein [Nitrosopumilaceae archaeon]